MVARKRKEAQPTPASFSGEKSKLPGALRRSRRMVVGHEIQVGADGYTSQERADINARLDGLGY